MKTIQGACVIGAAISTILFATWSPTKCPIWVPVGLLVLAAALSIFPAKAA